MSSKQFIVFLFGVMLLIITSSWADHSQPLQIGVATQEWQSHGNQFMPPWIYNPADNEDKVHAIFNPLASTPATSTQPASTSPASTPPASTPPAPTPSNVGNTDSDINLGGSGGSNDGGDGAGDGGGDST